MENAKQGQDEQLLKASDRSAELIVCAAVKFIFKNQKDVDLGKQGVETIIPMVRHYSPDGREVMETILDRFEECDLQEVEQGFMTNKCRFVSRKEAFEIAKANSQIKYNIGYNPKVLYSEMLY